MWTRGDAAMLTASGDQSIRMFDTAYAEPVGTFIGHEGSVKTIAVSKNNNGDVFASGARDGVLYLWDARSPSQGITRNGRPLRNAVLMVEGAHAPEASASGGATPRTRRSRNSPLMGHHRHAVTSLLFHQQDPNLLISGGVDGIVKFWDVRYCRSTAASAPVVTLNTGGIGPIRAAAGNNNAIAGTSGPLFTSALDHITPDAPSHCPPELIHLSTAPTPMLGQKQHGITCMDLSPDDGSNLLVSLTGGHCLLYNMLRPQAGPTHWFGGNTVGSFYIKSCFSPDGSHIVSGSSDGGVYVWQVDGRDGGDPYVMRGHGGEVTTVAWCPSDFCELASASDTGEIKIWSYKNDNGGLEEEGDIEGEEECDRKGMEVRYSNENSAARRTAGVDGDENDENQERNVAVTIRGGRDEAGDPPLETARTGIPTRRRVNPTMETPPAVGGRLAASTAALRAALGMSTVNRPAAAAPLPPTHLPSILEEDQGGVCDDSCNIRMRRMRSISSTAKMLGGLLDLDGGRGTIGNDGGGGQLWRKKRRQQTISGFLLPAGTARAAANAARGNDNNIGEADGNGSFQQQQQQQQQHVLPKSGITLSNGGGKGVARKKMRVSVDLQQLACELSNGGHGEEGEVEQPIRGVGGRSGKSNLGRMVIEGDDGIGENE